MPDPETPGSRLPIDPDLTPADPAEPSVTHHPGSPPARRLHPAVLVAVWVGGALGTVARYGVGRALPAPAGGFPLAVFLINTSGAFALGLLLTLLLGRFRHRTGLARPFFGTGVLGGWTTFSTLVVGVDTLFRAGRPAMAIGYLVATSVAGLAAAAVGIAAARRWTSTPTGAPN